MFAEKVMQIAFKLNKKTLSFIKREIQTETTMTNYFQAFILGKIKKFNNIVLAKVGETEKLIYCWWECKLI